MNAVIKGANQTTTHAHTVKNLYLFFKHDFILFFFFWGGSKNRKEQTKMNGVAKAHLDNYSVILTGESNQATNACTEQTVQKSRINFNEEKFKNLVTHVCNAKLRELEGKIFSSWY